MGSRPPLRAAAIGALLLLCALLTLDWAGAATGRHGPRAIEPFAPDLAGITLRDATGTARPLAELLPSGGPALLHVWATWCLPCLDELPALAGFARALEAEGLAERLLLVSVDRGPYERIEDYLTDRLGLDELRSWQAVDGDLGTALRLTGYPSTLVLDGAGRVAGRAEGSLPWADPALRARLRDDFGLPF